MNASFFLKAAHSSTSSAQHSPKEISGDSSIVWALENQSGVEQFADVVEICAIWKFWHQGCPFCNDATAGRGVGDDWHPFLRDGQGTEGWLAAGAALEFLDAGSVGRGPSFPLFLVWQ